MQNLQDSSSALFTEASLSNASIRFSHYRRVHESIHTCLPLCQHHNSKVNWVFMHVCVLCSDVFCGPRLLYACSWPLCAFHLVAYRSAEQAQRRGKTPSAKGSGRTLQQAISTKLLWPQKERLQRETAEGWNETSAACRSNSDGLFIVTDKMKINISHICVRLRGEHKPYCDFNEPWPCWTGLTNEVNLPVDDPESRSDAGMSFCTDFFVCLFLQLKRIICQFLCTILILQWITFLKLADIQTCTLYNKVSYLIKSRQSKNTHTHTHARTCRLTLPVAKLT